MSGLSTTALGAPLGGTVANVAEPSGKPGAASADRATRRHYASDVTGLTAAPAHGNDDHEAGDERGGRNGGAQSLP